MPRDEDLNEAAARHIRELDAHLERLKRQNETLDALSEAQAAEVEELKRLLSQVGEQFRAKGEEEPPND
jgi:predicted RNase H-like nuclease (RuvC/YqgF family)